MNTRIIHRALSVAVAMAACLSMTSCGDDDDKEKDEPSDPAAIRQIETNYRVDVTEDYLTFYDITVSYGFDGSEGTTETLEFDSWSFEQSLPAVDIAGAGLYCKVVATPKRDTPAIDPDKVYYFYHSYDCSVSGIRNDGQKTVLDIKSFENKSTAVKGDRLDEFLTRGQRDIVSYSYRLK